LKIKKTSLRGKASTLAQATAMTILAPALAMPLASDLDPTCQSPMETNIE